MQNAWQSFLNEAGAVIEAGGVRHFGHPQAEMEAAAGKNIIADLSHFSLIRARGADAENFLQAQLSNDIRSLEETSRLAAYCNAQGRALAIFRVFKSTDSFLLQLHRSLLEPTLKRLRMFVLRAQVVLESADQELARIGLSGPDTPRLLQDLSLAPGTKPNDCRTQNGLTLVHLPGIFPRFEIIGAYAAIQNLWLRLTPVPMNLRPEAAPTFPTHEPAAGGRTDFPSATDPFVALPPASMQSSPAGRGWPEGPGEGETARFRGAIRDNGAARRSLLTTPQTHSGLPSYRVGSEPDFRFLHRLELVGAA